MINLNAYDVLEYNFKYWIRKSNKTMYLKGLKQKEHYCFFCRYDTNFNQYDYFILLTNDDIDKDFIKIHNIFVNKRNIIQINLSKIWNDLNLSLNKEYNRINIILESYDDNNELYKIDFNP